VPYGLEPFTLQNSEFETLRRYSNTATTLLRLDSGHRLAEILRYCLRTEARLGAGVA